MTAAKVIAIVLICHAFATAGAHAGTSGEAQIDRFAREFIGTLSEADIATFEKAIAGREYIAADFFTAADLFVGANVNFMLAFNLLEPRPAFVDYARRMTDRDAYRRAKEIDSALIAEAQAGQEQPA